MSSTRRTDDAAKAVSKIALEPSRRQELWDAIAQRIDMETQQNGTATSAVPKRRNRSDWGQLGAAVVALVLIASGITYGAHHESLLKTTKSTTGTTNVTSLPTPKSTIQLTLTLPNGQTVKPDQTVAWKDLSLSLIITSLPPINAGTQIFGVIMGDGANRISQETVSTSIGSGELWYTQRKDSTYAYYTIVNGNQNAYVLQAVVTGNPGSAKSEVASLLNSLHVSGGDAKPASNQTTSTKQPSNPLFDTTLPLPDGRAVQSDGRNVRWMDLTLSLRVTSLPPAYAGVDGYLSIVGNNANIISHENVSTSAGRATFVYFQRTPPAAASGTGSTLTKEFYVISYGREYAYVIQATVTGNVSTAKSELMSLLQGWKIPFQAPTIPSPNAGLKQWRYDSVIGQQIIQSLNGISFKVFYLPVFITDGDSFVGVESKKNVVTVHFKNMTLMQSPNSITPSGTVAQSKVINFTNLFLGTKVTVYTMADKSLTLAIKVPLGTHMLLSSPSISLHQLETILQNIDPLNG